jgi:hypothetical protein
MERRLHIPSEYHSLLCSRESTSDEQTSRQLTPTTAILELIARYLMAKQISSEEVYLVKLVYCNYRRS